MIQPRAARWAKLNLENSLSRHLHFHDKQKQSTFGFDSTPIPISQSQSQPALLPVSNFTLVSATQICFCLTGDCCSEG